MKLKKIILILFALGFIGAIVAVYIYNKPHANYEKMKPDFTMTATMLVSEFESDESAANSKYLNKMILVTGSVADVSVNDAGEYSIALNDPMFGVTCNFNSEQSDEQKTLLEQLKVDAKVQIKGRCDGYLTDVRLTQCSLVEGK